MVTKLCIEVTRIAARFVLEDGSKLDPRGPTCSCVSDNSTIAWRDSGTWSSPISPRRRRRRHDMLKLALAGA